MIYADSVVEKNIGKSKEQKFAIIQKTQANFYSTLLLNLSFLSEIFTKSQIFLVGIFSCWASKVRLVGIVAEVRA